MNKLQHQYLTAMGIPVWQLKQAPAVQETPQTDSWEILQKAVVACQACQLHCSRTQTVFGVGDRLAKLMIIGEAPGFYEDQQGEPFVGRAGKLLNAMLQALQLDRSQVYIANILKCRPPENRDPQPEEVEQCTPFLNRQIALLQPRLLLAVGRVAAHFLLKNKRPLSELRGKTYSYGEKQIPLLVTYHPAYLLRNPRDKANAYEDLLRVEKALVSLD